MLWWSDHYTRLRAYQILADEKPQVFVENPVLLTWMPMRRTFTRRFGFDPLARIEVGDPSQVPLVAQNIARQARLPVIVFDAPGAPNTDPARVAQNR
ncbi:MAG: hypothetical protein WEF50_12765 [Myxococcota bacterium]